MINKCAKFHKDSPSGKIVKFNLPSAIELRRRPILCTTLYRNLMEAGNFGGAFDQLFFWILSTSSIPCKKVRKWPKLKSRGSCLNHYAHWGSNSNPEVQPCVKSPPWNPRYWLPSLNSCSCNPKSPESELTPTPAIHSHQPSTNLSHYQPFSFPIRSPANLTQTTDLSWPTNWRWRCTSKRLDVHTNYSTGPFYRSNRIYCVVSIVCCVYHVCRK